MTTTSVSPAGILAAPGNPRFDEATATYNLALDTAPELAATVTSVDEVRAALAAAREHGRPVRVHSTGHAALGAAPYTGHVLLRTMIAGDVVIDVENATATIPAGATWGQVVEASAPFALAPLHGSSPDVGAVGYLLRGGISFYGRKHGLASNSLLSIDLVLADGSLVRTDENNDSELFDALRGGGGGFGIVVGVTVALISVPSVATGSTFWPASEAAFLLKAWEEWTHTAPNEASTAFRIMNLPPLPGVPPVLTAGPVVCIDGAVLNGADRSGAEIAGELLDPLRAHSAPLLDTWHEGTAADVPFTHMDPPNPSPFHGGHLLLTSLDSRAQQEFLAVAGQPSGATLAVIELRQLGGAIAEANPAGGVLNSISGGFAYFAAGLAMGPNTFEAIDPQLEELRARLNPWSTGFTAPTYVDSYTSEQKSFAGDVAERVEATRRRVDPDGVFSFDVAPGARVHAG